MEQDRTSPLLVHQPELAREAAGELCSDPQPDCRDGHVDGADGRERAGHEQLPTGRKISDGEMATLKLQRDAVHGEWNDTISPRPASSETIIV